MSSSAPGGAVNLDALIAEFYRGDHNDSPLGQFMAVDSVPTPYDHLLDHEHHMTVMVESFHGCSVDVRVHHYHQSGHWYVREITLTKSGSDEVVQYGIVRFDTTSVHQQVWQAIESRTIPLGRVLIQWDVMRLVHLCQLWKITVGDSMAKILEADQGSTVYGRTALIDCNGKPAIELLEVVKAKTA